jgi:hypothetical protein
MRMGEREYECLVFIGGVLAVLIQGLCPEACRPRLASQYATQGRSLAIDRGRPGNNLTGCLKHNGSTSLPYVAGYTKALEPQLRGASQVTILKLAEMYIGMWVDSKQHSI